MITYFSNAEWPEGAGVLNSYGERKSQDSHQTERAALSVCKMLEKDGLGGNGVIFPIRTWASEKCSHEKSGWCNSTSPCQYKEKLEDGLFICEGCL